MSATGRLRDLWQRVRRRLVGLRSRLGLMLVGVLVLVLWQTGLAIGYTLELFRLAETVEDLSGAAASATSLTRSIHARVDDGVPATREDLQERLEELGLLAGEARKASASSLHLGPLARIADAVDRHAEALERAFETLDRRQPTEDAWVRALEDWRLELGRRLNAWDIAHPEPDAEEATTQMAWLRDFAHRLPDRVAAQALSDRIWDLAEAGAERRRAVRALEQAAADVRGQLTELRAALASETGQASAAIRSTVDRADRYLVTLLLMTIVYVGLILFVLPARLARPFRHLASVIRRASQGRYDVRARVGGTDELGGLGDALNEMLARAATFDELKRERIYQDHARIRTMGELVPHPVAILDTHFRLVHANRPFGHVFRLGDHYEDQDVRERIVGSDAAEFHRALDAALRRQRSVSRVPLVVSGETSWKLTVEPGRDSHGRIAWLLMTLEPADEDEAAPA